MTDKDLKRPADGRQQLDPYEKETAESPSRRINAAFFLTFILLLGTWILLSGKFDAFHLSLGVISCLLVSYFSNDLLFSSFNIKNIFIQWPRFLLYIPWLLYQIFKANIHMMYLVFHPRMMELIDPRIIKFRSRLKSEMSLVTFASSITLTPGTITVYVTEYGDFEVHVIDKPSGDSLPGDMETRIAKIFDE